MLLFADCSLLVAEVFLVGAAMAGSITAGVAATGVAGPDGVVLVAPMLSVEILASTSKSSPVLRAAFGVDMTPESPGWDPPIITLRVVGSSYVFKSVFDRLKVLLRFKGGFTTCLLYTSPSPRDVEESRMPSSA